MFNLASFNLASFNLASFKLADSYCRSPLRSGIGAPVLSLEVEIFHIPGNSG